MCIIPDIGSVGPVHRPAWLAGNRVQVSLGDCARRNKLLITRNRSRLRIRPRHGCVRRWRSCRGCAPGCSRPAIMNRRGRDCWWLGVLSSGSPCHHVASPVPAEVGTVHRCPSSSGDRFKESSDAFGTRHHSRGAATLRGVRSNRTSSVPTSTHLTSAAGMSSICSLHLAGHLTTLQHRIRSTATAPLTFDVASTSAP